MNSRSFINDNGEDIQSYSAIDLTIKTFIEIIETISTTNSVVGGYMVRHSKFKGISYNSDDEYVDQFITLYVPPKKKDGVKKYAVDSSVDNNNNENNESVTEEVAEEDIHEFSFDAKYSIDDNNKTFYICDPGIGNRIALNSILNVLHKVSIECGNYCIKYRNDNSVYDINEIYVNSSMKSIKFH
jgi:hypothetical protein